MFPSVPELSELQDKDIDNDLLPPQLRCMVRLAGVRETAKLLGAWGGTRRHIPKQPTADTKICQVVSLDAACHLATHFGGQRIEVPQSNRLLDQARDKRTRSAAAMGASNHDLAYAYGLTSRTIKKICRCCRETYSGGVGQ